MSDQQDTQRVSVPVDGCSVMVDDYMRGVEEIRASFNPAYTMHFDHELIPDKPMAATVTVNVGSTRLTFTPEVWAAIAEAVQSATPSEVHA